jgi:hypothetical protein
LWELLCAIRFDNEALWSMTDKVERVARHKRESRPGTRLQNVDIARIDNSSTIHNVFVPVIQGRNLYDIAYANILQRPKETIPVARDGEVAVLAWKRCAGDSANTAVESQIVDSLEQRRMQMQPDNRHHGHWLGEVCTKSFAICFDSNGRPISEIDLRRL